MTERKPAACKQEEANSLLSVSRNVFYNDCGLKSLYKASRKNYNCEGLRKMQNF